MIPWKLTSQFDKEQHLFSNSIDTDYVIHSFKCSCGHVVFLIEHSFNEADYACPVCSNIDFYNANDARQDIGYFLSQNSELELDYSFGISTCSDSIEAKYTTKLPESIDFLRKKIISSEKKIYGLSILSDGEKKESFEMEKNEDIFEKLKRNLIKQLNETPEHFNLPTSRETKLNLNNTTFFLQNKHLREFDFCSWIDVKSLPLENINIQEALR